MTYVTVCVCVRACVRACRGPMTLPDALSLMENTYWANGPFFGDVTEAEPDLTLITARREDITIKETAYIPPTQVHERIPHHTFCLSVCLHRNFQ